MKKSFNPLRMLLTFVITLALLLISRPVWADTGNTDFGITNAALAGTATFSTLGAPHADIRHQDNVTLVFRATVITSNAAPTAVLTFNRVDSEGHIETTPRFQWGTIPLATGGDAGTFVTNQLVAITNVPLSVIGALSELRLTNIVTANMTGPGIISNPVVKVELKTVKKE